MNKYKTQMRRVGFTSAVLIILLAMATVLKANVLYLGVDFGKLTFDQPEFENVNNTSVLLGYQFSNWAIEGGYHVSKTVNKFFCGDQKVKMYHLYSVYRSFDEIYYKLKLGLTNERYRLFDSLGNIQVDDVHTGIARGVGVGYRFNSLSLELEYNWLGGSLEMISGGVKINF